MLFIHGLEDRYVPWRMSVVMAETRRRRLPKAVTELLLVPGAKHGGSLAADREVRGGGARIPRKRPSVGGSTAN